MKMKIIKVNTKFLEEKLKEMGWNKHKIKHALGNNKKAKKALKEWENWITSQPLLFFDTEPDKPMMWVSAYTNDGSQFIQVMPAISTYEELEKYMIKHNHNFGGIADYGYDDEHINEYSSF
jgi:hypothetical protein